MFPDQEPSKGTRKEKTGPEEMKEYVSHDAKTRGHAS